MAKGTDFGGVHSSRDLQLIQQQVDVQPALPKLNIIDIPGADGSVDLSEQPAGRVVYEDRAIEWTFALYPGDDWHTRHRLVAGALSGRLCKITLDDDPDYYYYGRLSVSKYNKDNLLRQITVKAICRPYKLKQQETVVAASLTTNYTNIVLPNDRKPATPSVTVTAETTVLWGEDTVTIAAGNTAKLLDVTLQEGENVLQAKTTSGTGSIHIAYQEGAL